MQNNVSFLTLQQNAFLEENFVVYDPDTEMCYSDFSSLANSKFVFIGERHGTQILHDIQGQFLKLFGSCPANQPSCLLMEGLLPENIIQREEIPSWSDIPASLVIQGSDTRKDFSHTTKDYLSFNKVRYQKIEKVLELKKAFQMSAKQIAQLLNQNFLLGKVTLEKDFLVVDQSLIESVKTLIASVQSKATEIDTLVSKLDKLSGKGESAQMSFSNIGLLNTILKMHKHFHKVFAIWGSGHAYTGSQLFAGLDKNHIKYTILLPNPRRELEAKEESEWQTDDINLATLSLVSRELLTKNPRDIQSNDFGIPECFCSYFHPKIQKILAKPEKVTSNYSVKITTEELLEFISEKDFIEFPPHACLQLQGIHPDDFMMIDELNKFGGDVTEIETGSVNHRNKDAALARILDNIFLFQNKRLVNFSSNGGFSTIIGYKNHRRRISVTSNEAIVLETTREDLHTTPDYLFKEMKRRNLVIFNVEPNQHLVFLNMTVEQQKALLDNPNSCFSWLNQFAPENFRVVLQGEIGLKNATISHESKENEIGIALSSENGFNILLIPQAE